MEFELKGKRFGASNTLQRSRQTRRAVRFRVCTSAALASISTKLLAATDVWNGGTGSWNSAANWSGGIPNSSTVDVLIDAANSLNSAVTLNGAVTVGSLNLDAGDTLTV